MKKITLLLLLNCIVQISSAQNTCDTALPITAAGSYVVAAVDGTQVPAPICADNGGGATKGEWYVYTPTQNYTVTVTTNIPANTPKVDTRFHVYTGGCAGLTCYAGDDDAGAGYSSVDTFVVLGGTTYYIAWDNRWTSNGFTFDLIEAPYVEPIPTPITYTNQNISTVNSNYNICVVDMNGDHLDDIVGVSSTNIKVHRQNVGGGFTVLDYTTTAADNMPTWSLAAGDYNKDGYNDLLYGNGSGLTFMRSNSTGTAYTEDSPGQYIFCQRTNFIDINNDGNLDAFSCHDVDPNVYYINNGSGNFTYYQSGVTPGSVSLGTLSSGGNYASLWSDFDNDGDVDMFISKCSGPPCELHRNNGNGTYTDISATAQINFQPVQSWSSAISDFDNDGDMDIMVGSNGSVGHKFFKNNLDTTNSTEEAFSDITVGSGLDSDNSINRDYIAYDFDNDGFVDIMGSGSKILFNQGNNVFAPVSYNAIGVGAVGDLNNDGFLDILNGSTVRFAVPNGNNWVKLTFQGIQSNSNGIGARVELYGPWGKQIRDVRSGEGFEYMSTLNAHFGIGTATEISQVIIRWPSGVVDTINNPSPNQTIHVVEGSTLSSNSFTSATFSISPVPAKNVISIQANDSISFESAEIYDLNGRKIAESKLDNNSINVQSLSTGSYILLLNDSNGKRHTQKFIKE
ncbi:FG-GAP-like repeat-containing protein [Flavobacterium sp.]|uniref:FG-GAP-like repeat-containing protein n=1 Tax=Flavobacterium sp. TaxID=239 RepID=UPI002B4B5F1B|nr:FG-GAP-like repeat-containing protein [Flavobacterium sp.]HLP63802.1 FG-GAP-like repeat-containing protein [Flavobacterium sp.]